MITINLVGEVITGSYNGKNFGVGYTKELYDQMVKLQSKANDAKSLEEVKKIVEQFEPLTIEDFKATIEGADEHLHFNEKTGETFLKHKGVVSNVPMPKGFVDRLNESIEKDISILPMVKFWIRTLRNPKLTPEKLNNIVIYINQTYMDEGLATKLMADHGVSYEVAEARATQIQVPITEEGLLQTYKVSNEVTHKFNKETGEREDRYKPVYNEDTGIKTYTKPDFAEDLLFEPAIMGTSGDAFFCGNTEGHFIKVGETHRLASWDQVNCSDHQSGVKGLHVGNLDYIRGFQTNYSVTHNVFVDPMFIGAVPHDGTGVIRCKEYMVYDTFEGVTRSMYRSSEYAAKTDAQWEDMLAEAVKERKEFAATQVEAAEKASEQLESLSL